MTGRIVACAFAISLAVSASACSSDKLPEVERRNGQPLDAHEVVEYDRPAWLPDCERCLFVVNRRSGRSWWLLEFDDGSRVTMEDAPENVDKDN